MATFEQFMAQVDATLVRHFGLASDDLEDYAWNDYFDDDYSADELPGAVCEAVAMWAYDHGFDGNPATYEAQS